MTKEQEARTKNEGTFCLQANLQKITCGDCARFKWCKKSPVLRKTKDSIPCGIFDQKHSKMGNKKITIDGRVFHSIKESERYCELKLLLRAGEIIKFKCQPEFILQDEFIKNGVKFQAITYRADFEVTYPDGHIEIEDVKAAKEYKTDVYRIKQKMFEFRYLGLTIKEIY